MSDAMDRGARILNEWQALDTHDDCRRAFAAALRAALDPEDAGLVERVARYVTSRYGTSHDSQAPETIERYVDANWDIFAVTARDAIAALRAHCGEGE